MSERALADLTPNITPAVINPDDWRGLVHHTHRALDLAGLGSVLQLRPLVVNGLQHFLLVGPV